MVTINNILKRLYETAKSPHSYGGVQGLLRTAQKVNPSITKKDIESFLLKQNSYTLHKITRRKFTRRKILAPKPGVIVTCDLADMSKLSQHNNGYKYILVFIDVFSRFAQVTPVKRKDGQTMLNAFKIILNSGYFNNISRLNSDEGKEFYNPPVLKYLKSKNIILYSVSSREIKASIAERFIRTLKSKLYRYMSHHNTQKYIDILPDIIESYNNSFHRNLPNQQTPLQIHKLTNPKTIDRVFFKMYKTPLIPKRKLSSSLTIGEYVRISDEKKNHVFRRGYTIQNTIEIFKIQKVDSSQNPTVYYLEDLNKEPIIGVFYREELIPTHLPEVFHIEILKTKIVSGHKKYFVQWLGYPSTFNTWIDETQLVKL